MGVVGPISSYCEHQKKTQTSLNMNNLPPELVERINRPDKKRSTPFETNSGGFIPYNSMNRRSQSLGATVLSNNASVVHVAETSHWLTRNEVGDPSKTAWMINDKGNKVWFKYEHTPSLFPVKETRFYKPKLHKTDFLNPQKNEDDERTM